MSDEQEKLEKALEFANYRITVQNQKHVLKTRAIELLTYYHNGGTFNITHEFMGFIGSLIANDHTSLPLLDSNNNPIMVEDLQEFYEEMLGQYMEVVNEYWKEYEELKTKRNVKSVVNV